MVTNLDSDIVSELNEKEIAYLNPICEFLGINLPDPTKGVLRIGPNEFKEYSYRLIEHTFEGEYVGPSEVVDEGPNFYFDVVLPRIERHARYYKNPIVNKKTVIELNIYDYMDRDLQEFFLQWQQDVVAYLSKNASVIDSKNDIYFVKYELRHRLKIPRDRDERREFLESVPLCTLRFYKTGKQAIIENMLWYSLLHRDYEKAENRIRLLYFWIAVLGSICVGLFII